MSAAKLAEEVYRESTMEVNNIWPQPTLKLGKLLFLGMRYCNIAYLTFDYAFNTSNHGTISVQACQTLYEGSWSACPFVTSDLFVPLTHALDTTQYFGSLQALSHKASCKSHSSKVNTSSSHLRSPGTATCWLCLYALLGSKRFVLWVMVVLFIILWVPVTVFGYMYMKSERYIPQGAIDADLGYPCSFTLDAVKPTLNSVASYITAARAFLVLFVSIFVMYRRYHYGKYNGLLSVIKREGGIYLFAQVVIDVIAGLKDTKRVKFPDPYGIVSIIRVTILLIFADRLLLKMHKREESEATVVSTMRFDRGPPESEATLDEEATRQIQVGEKTY
ncbi:hypothetical protein NMY22_g16 [Coprinellus aureogranulatus]|nr:hypothetical protein NMY22_g16 [Coprinellus aureogranulatus]